MHRRRHLTISWSAVLALALSLIATGGSSVWPSVAAAASDATPPTVYSPVVRFRPLVTFGSYPQVSITIVGRDAGSGMGGTPQWAVSRNGGAFNRLTPTSSTTTWSDISNGVPHTAAVVIYRTLVLAGTYRFAGRMFDRAGNASRWVYGPTISPRIIQETATNIIYSDGWIRANNNLWSWEETGGTGEIATMNVYARAFAWVSSQGADKGEAEVWVDGRYVKTVNLYRLQPLASRTTMFTKTWSATGLHTVRIVVLGTPGHPVVDIDAFLVLR